MELTKEQKQFLMKDTDRASSTISDVVNYYNELDLGLDDEISFQILHNYLLIDGKYNMHNKLAKAIYLTIGKSGGVWDRLNRETLNKLSDFLGTTIENTDYAYEEIIEEFSDENTPKIDRIQKKR